ncbi:MAG: extracellular solute-binding protein [Deltaproteobacteria bacterium]|nr:extracellular solute-binding protein [Deltaproteobacteria bacterium]
MGRSPSKLLRFVVVLAALSVAPLPRIASGKTPLKIYTSVPKNIILPITKTFARLNPDIDFTGYRAGTNQIIQRVKSDLASSGRVESDLIWVADPAYFLDLKDQGLLLKYTSPKASVIPSIYKDPDGFFTAGRILNMGITFNRDLVPPAESPKDWQDLLDKKWKDQIAMPNPNNSGSSLDTVEALSSRLGWDYFEKLKGNGLKVIKSSTRIVKEVANGKFKIAIALDFITRNQAASGGPLGFNYPQSGAVSIASPVAIIKTTRNPAAAKRFIDFILSNEGQRAVVQFGNLYPVNPLIAPPKGAPPFNSIAKKALPINWIHIKENRSEIIKRFSNIMKD